MEEDKIKLMELKSLAYDAITAIEFHRANLNSINEQIAILIEKIKANEK